MSERISKVLDRIEARQQCSADEPASALEHCQDVYRGSAALRSGPVSCGERGAAIRDPEARGHGGQQPQWEGLRHDARPSNCGEREGRGRATDRSETG
jgi:hypothetical protein